MLFNEIRFDGNLIIRFSHNSLIKQNISDSTPQINFINHHFSDIMKEMGALKVILKRIKAESAYDLMGGCGFSGKMILKYTDCKSLLINDFDPVCFDILNANFEDEKVDIFQGNILDFIWQKIDLAFIDFNSFTLNKLDKWKEVLKCAVEYSNDLVITDSACFGFNMGNLKSYKVKDELSYYNKLSILLNIPLRSVCNFGHAALVHFSHKDYKLKFLKYDHIDSSRLLC